MRDAVGGDEIGVAESWAFLPAVNRSKTKFNGRKVGAKVIYLTGVASDSTEISSVQEMYDKVYLTKLIPPNEYSDRSAYAPVSFIFLLS